ncbi:ATP-dependent Clp protease proteolytic subunit [Clostridium sp. AM58-1XD]|uniref:ClpP family protease n=1 Tax=Clostridium sp. AM58-1XD TaxID=2292307 RepID=UPI000E4866F0|nr:ATP-dependent Clp protease proteolytic subunit [Clostridium sp. AM58-1XD]RGY99439.1 peptidase S14 [Clostridium sp. AM58-1XD]
MGNKKNHGNDKNDRSDKNDRICDKNDKNDRDDGRTADNLDEQKKQGEVDEKKDAKLEEYGQAVLDSNRARKKIYLLSIIGEVEGHENLPSNSKATKYDHVLPKLAELEDDHEIEGLLILLNTSGGDVDAGLAIAEMIASLSMPTVSLVLGGSHSIGVPLAVCTDYSFIVPTGTMMIHPVRMSGMVIGAEQTYEYFDMIQDRILSFVSDHSTIPYDKLKQLMHNTEMLTRDLGTVLVGEETVKEGLINEVGGIKEALQKLYGLIDEQGTPQK